MSDYLTKVRQYEEEMYEQRYGLRYWSMKRPEGPQRETITRKEWDALDEVQRSAHFKAGGKIVDKL